MIKRLEGVRNLKISILFISINIQRGRWSPFYMFDFSLIISSDDLLLPLCQKCSYYTGLVTEARKTTEVTAHAHAFSLCGLSLLREMFKRSWGHLRNKAAQVSASSSHLPFAIPLQGHSASWPWTAVAQLGRIYIWKKILCI